MFGIMSRVLLNFLQNTKMKTSKSTAHKEVERGEIFPISYGKTMISGIKMPNGKLLIANRQVFKALPITFREIRNINRDVLKYLPKGYKFITYHTPLSVKAISCVTIEDFHILIDNLLKTKNADVMNLFGLAFPEDYQKRFNKARPTQLVGDIGFIYLLQAHNAVKLGWSVTLDEAIKTFSRWEGELDLIARIEGSKDILDKILIDLETNRSVGSLGNGWYPLNCCHKIKATMKYHGALKKY